MSKAALQARVAELEARTAKLERINQALIERVESDAVQHSGPWEAFQHSVVLAEQVRERTDALNQALSDLKVSHRDLQQANVKAAVSHQRLVDAIESISEGFALFDDQRRIVLFNQKFADQWQAVGVDISQGTHILDIKRLAQQSGLVSEIVHSKSSQAPIFRLHTERWLQVSERPTTDGGRVVLFTDITDLKADETVRREEALAQKTRVLQRTIGNLSQGVVLITPDGRLELWNQRFIELTGVDVSLLDNHPPFSTLVSHDAHQVLQPDSKGDACSAEQVLADGRVIEVRNHPMPDGGFINTYTDITERHQHAQQLRESERWIRLITDQVPALIAYVDRQLHYSFTNKVYDEWYGWPRGALTGQHIRQVHGDAQFARLQPWVERAMAGEQVTFEIDERNARDELRYMLKSYVPNLSPDGETVGMFVLIRDITERRRTNEALHEAYQHMEQRVQERTSELQDLNDQLLLEIDERRDAEARLREASKDAEQANLSKTKFLAAVSHDLLQPLNAARLFTGALAEQPIEAQAAGLVRSVCHSLEDLESLITTLVDISKLDAGVVKPDITSFQISDLLDNLANEYSQVARAEGVELRFVASHVVVQSDTQLLSRILRNFLSNALRYTDQGSILLGCRRRADCLELEVADTGIGIAQAQLGEIFQEFKRLGPSNGRQDSGLGLGLAIVDKISRVLGHPVSVRSQEGKGSVFSVQVPYGNLQPSKEGFEALLPMPVNQLDQARIWVIDNDPAICDAMATLMEGWGCQVLTALSLDDLCQQVDPASSDVQLIIADYHLDNDETGLDAARALNQRLPGPVPVLMITANYGQDLKQQIRESGYLLIHKPVKPMKLKTTLSHLLEQADVQPAG